MSGVKDAIWLAAARQLAREIEIDAIGMEPDDGDGHIRHYFGMRNDGHLLQMITRKGNPGRFEFNYYGPPGGGSVIAAIEVRPETLVIRLGGAGHTMVRKGEVAEFAESLRVLVGEIVGREQTTAVVQDAS